ncbi:MAG: Holliday junction branch migration protein RuvA [Gammaproteobacteria bacterium]|nr:Holliday junction branch migration protein RuvA [Gammaproteobacteria bacterium]MCW8982568.1 Holliday junction branch migration protein RuvA [Gammaproteobacteria bacterium]
MIGRLRGVLAEKLPPQLLIDVAGVGYEVEAPMSTFYQLPETGQELTLLIHMVVREDAQLLFGFATERERKLFRTLIKVNGVGAKLALTILSGIAADEFARAVQDNDTAALVRLPGIGKKTAERLIVEMSDRLNDWQPVATLQQGSESVVTRSSAVQDAVSALIALGYKPQEASRLVGQVETDGLASEMVIKAALKISVT